MGHDIIRMQFVQLLDVILIITDPRLRVVDSPRRKELFILVLVYRPWIERGHIVYAAIDVLFLRDPNPRVICAACPSELEHAITRDQMALLANFSRLSSPCRSRRRVSPGLNIWCGHTRFDEML